MGVCREKAVGGEDDGKWQLGVSRRRWAVVNSRYQVRTGCYQTFKAESNWLLLQQGVKRWCCQNHRTLPPFGSALSRVHAPRVQRVVHPWTSRERQLSLQLWASFWASLHFLNWYSGWSQSSPCPSSAATKCRPIATDAVSILRGLMHTCAQLRRPYGAHKKKKACSVYYFFISMPRSSDFSVSWLCVLYVCVCMFECEIMRSCTCGFFEISEKHCR